MRHGEGAQVIRFNNDYNRTGHPRVIEALAQTTTESHPGYGLDGHCERARDIIRRVIGNPSAAVHFVVGGTQANALVIRSLLAPYQGVLSAADGHINVHETGAVEFGGTKVIAVATEDGKITAADIERLAVEFETSPVPEHVVEPALAYLSFPNEFGALFSAVELREISDACHRHGWRLFIDGARLGYGLGSPACDATIRDIAQAADVFTIGGTKCGALFGEAVVFAHDGLAPRFRSHIKQQGGMLAKGWLLGAQFEALLADGLYFDICAHATRLSLRIRDAFAKAGVPFRVASETNQQFVVLSHEQADALAERYVFDPEGVVDDCHVCVRFCTSWATTEQDVDQLVRDISTL